MTLVFLFVLTIVPKRSCSLCV